MHARVLCLALLPGFLLTLSACAAGNNGGDALAFIRATNLYRIQPDGSTVFQIASGHVVGFAWSPDHHSLVLRAALQNGTPAPGLVPVASVPDLTAAYGVVSIDGGNVLAIAPEGAVVRSDAFWNTQGNRLLYRERYGTTTYWFQSQADQPAGIARKEIVMSPTIPATSPDGSQWAAVDASGQLLAGPAQHLRVISQGLASAPDDRPARLLWQPHTNAVLAAVAGATAGTTTLRLFDLAGASKDLAMVSGLNGYSFAPDGQHLLWHDTHGYVILSLATGQRVSWAESAGVPWWSPDGANVLLLAADHASLIAANTGKVTNLVRWTAAANTAPQAADALPATGSPWSADSHHFAMALPGGTWLATGTPTNLASGKGAGTGLYVVDRAALSLPKLADWGEHGGLSWSTPDPNTQWLWP